MSNSALLAPRVRSLGFVAAAAISTVLITASPAFAADDGSATGTGEETGFTTHRDFGNQDDPHCLEVTASSYSVDLTGTFYAGTGNSISYTGPATLTWTTTQTYYIDEEGTYTNATMQSGCDLGTLGNGITSTVTLTGGNTTDGVICSSLTNGQYSRNNGPEITLTFTGPCTVYDDNSTGSATTASNTVYTFTGLLIPCFETDPSCESSTIVDGSLTY